MQLWNVNKGVVCLCACCRANREFCVLCLHCFQTLLTCFLNLFNLFFISFFSGLVGQTQEQTADLGNYSISKHQVQYVQSERQGRGSRGPWVTRGKQMLHTCSSQVLLSLHTFFSCSLLHSVTHTLLQLSNTHTQSSRETRVTGWVRGMWAWETREVRTATRLQNFY